MSILRSLRRKIAPDFSVRSIAYGVLRESMRNPIAIFKRINRVNLENYKSLSRCQIDCNVCGKHTGVFYDFPNVSQRKEHRIGLLRETVSCRACGATMRHRTLAQGLLEQIGRLTGQRFSSLMNYRDGSVTLRILDTDCYSPLHQILTNKAGYLSSKYLPGTVFGTQLAAGIYNIDLQAISFPEEQFDIVLTSDVMEHVENDGQAHGEICRVLKKGGAYVFTVPYDANLKVNNLLAFSIEGGHLYTTTPHFHGDPITGGILAYRVYGQELFDSFRSLNMDLEFFDTHRAANGIFSGDYFTAIKR